MASETTELVGANVAALRLRAKMTQQQLAEKCKVARPRIAEIESGKFNPTVETVECIAKALGVDISRIFRRTAT